MTNLARLRLAAITTALSAVTLVGQSGRLDGTSDAGFDRSVARLAGTLHGDERALFERTIGVYRRITNDRSDARLRFHGFTVQDVLALGRRLTAKHDSNRNGVLDDDELLPIKQQLARSRRRANESAAVAMLRNIWSAQAQTQCSGCIDADGDGNGEFAFFAELTGAMPVRTGSGSGSRRLNPPPLSSRYVVHDRRLMRHGYLFQIWLPGRNGRPVSEAKQGGIDERLLPDHTLAAQGWTCYAWPVDRGVTGQRAFAIDQAGNLLATDNTSQRYSGTHRAPAPLAAFAMGTNALPAELGGADRHRDNGTWRVETQATPARGR